jgi:hypothetical protein
MTIKIIISPIKENGQEIIRQEKMVADCPTHDAIVHTLPIVSLKALENYNNTPKTILRTSVTTLFKYINILSFIHQK